MWKPTHQAPKTSEVEECFIVFKGIFIVYQNTLLLSLVCIQQLLAVQQAIALHGGQ